MKFTATAEALRLAAKRAALVIERRGTTPILSHVLIAATGTDLIELFGTDLDMQISETMAADRVERDGAVAVDARALCALASGWAKGSLVEIEAGEGRVTVRNGRSSSSLPTLHPDDMPRMNEHPRETRFALPAALLLGQIARVRHAISTEEHRYYLNGIYWHGRGGMLRMVATDGHRLGLTETAGGAGAGGDFSALTMPGVIVPMRAVDVLRKLLACKSLPRAKAGGAPECRCEVGPEQLRFTVGNTVLTSKTIDGTFPEYERVIPRGNEIVLSFVRKEMLDTVARLLKLYPFQAIRLDAAADGIDLSASSPEAGAASEHVDGRLKGRPIEVGFNGRYLLDTLGALSGEEATIALSDHNGAAIIADPADASATHVLMPMRV